MKFSFYLSDIEGIFFAAVRLFRILFFFFLQEPFMYLLTFL